MKQKLIDHYDKKASSTIIRQKKNIVTLTSNLINLIQEAHEEANTVENIAYLIGIIDKYIRTENTQ